MDMDTDYFTASSVFDSSHFKGIFYFFGGEKLSFAFSPII